MSNSGARVGTQSVASSKLNFRFLAVGLNGGSAFEFQPDQTPPTPERHLWQKGLRPTFTLSFEEAKSNS